MANISLQILRDQATQICDACDLVGWNNLNQRGRLEHVVYRAVRDTFSDTRTETEFIERIRHEIEFTNSRRGITGEKLTNEFRENGPYVFLLSRYVRNNFDPALWEHIPEFTHLPSGQMGTVADEEHCG